MSNLQTGIQQGVGAQQGVGVQQGVGLQQGVGIQQGVGLQQGGGLHQGVHYESSLGGPGIGTTILGTGQGIGHGIEQSISHGTELGTGLATGLGTAGGTTIYHNVTTVTQPQQIHETHIVGAAPIQQQVAQPVNTTDQYAQEALLRGVAPAGVQDHAGGLGSAYQGGAQPTGVNLTQTPAFSGTQPLVYQGDVPQVQHGHPVGIIGEQPVLGHNHGANLGTGANVGTGGMIGQHNVGAGGNIGTGGVYNPQN